MIKKYIPNIITIFRIIGSISLLFVTPLSIMFLIIYFLCGFSDILDGYISRKTNTCTKFGSTLDGFADFVFIIIMILIFILSIKIEKIILYWIGIIAIIKILSLVVGFIKYNTVAFLHTYANKFTGMILFCFPIIYMIFGIKRVAVALCIIATISAIEELLINLTSKKLNRNVRSILKL